MNTSGALRTNTYVAAPYNPPRIAHGFSSIDYPPMSEVMNIAVISLEVRYPESGCVRNTQSEMLIIILSGEIELVVRENLMWVSSVATSGKQVFVPKGAWYYWKPKVSTKMVVCSSPPWKAEQQEHRTHLR